MISYGLICVTITTKNLRKIVKDILLTETIISLDGKGLQEMTIRIFATVMNGN